MKTNSWCVCDLGTVHVTRRDGTYHRVSGLLVRVGSLTEKRLLARAAVLEIIDELDVSK